MPVLRFALDEDVAHCVAGLLHAAEARQTHVTHNSRDFRALHEAWVTWRRRWAREVEEVTGIAAHLSQHAGILMTPHLSSNDLVRILDECADTVGSMDDRLFAWSPTRGWHELHV